MCGVDEALNERINREQNGQCGCYHLGNIYSENLKSQLPLRKRSNCTEKKRKNTVDRLHRACNQILPSGSACLPKVNCENNLHLSSLSHKVRQIQRGGK